MGDTNGAAAQLPGISGLLAAAAAPIEVFLLELLDLTEALRAIRAYYQIASRSAALHCRGRDEDENPHVNMCYLNAVSLDQKKKKIFHVRMGANPYYCPRGTVV